MRKSFTRFLSLLFVFCLFCIPTIVNAQEAQKTVELYAEAKDVSPCYNASNEYEVKISMRDFIQLVQFDLVLHYEASVFNYESFTVTNSAIGSTTIQELTPGNLTIAWDNVTTPVTFGNNVKTDVITLKFSLDGFPNNLATSYLSNLTWNSSDFYYYNLIGGTEVVNTDVSTSGKLNVTVPATEISVAVSTVTCTGGDANITVNSPAQGSGYSYLFNEDPNFANWTWSTNASFSAPSPSSNTVRVKNNATGCISLAKTVLVDALAPVTYAATKQDAVCKGGFGELQINAVGGTGLYTYWVVPEADFTTVLNTLTVSGKSAASLANYKKTNFQISRLAGTYRVAVDDANLCKDLTVNAYWTQLVIAEPPTSVAVAVSNVSAETCDGANDGKFTVTVSGGAVGQYEVSISGRTATTEAGVYTFTGLTPGTYVVTAMDVNGCKVLSGNIVIAPKDRIEFTIVIDDTSCGNLVNGKITVSNIAGGTAPYSISIKEDVNTTTQSGVPASGVAFVNLKPTYYSLTITDANLCKSDYVNPNLTGNVIAVQSPDDINFVIRATNPLCYDGTAKLEAINVTGGAGVGYLYSIDNIAWQASNTFTVTQPFNTDYTIWVKNATGLGCSVAQTTDKDEVVALAQLIASISDVFPPTCVEGSDGNIYVNINGGVTPYSYSINNGKWVDSNDPLTIIKATVGTHTIKLRDANMCEIIAPLVVTVTQSSNVITAASSGTINCFGDKTATISVAFTSWADGLVNSIPTRDIIYKYIKTEGDVYTGTGFTPGVTTFTAGTYWVGVVDQYGCTAAPVKVEVIQNPTLAITSVVPNGASCYGTFGGTISIQATGGTIPVSGKLQYAVLNSEAGLDNIQESKWLNFETYNSENKISTVSFQVEKGNYWISVRDHVCSKNQKNYGPITVDGYDKLTINELLIAKTKAKCFGESNGSINVPANAATGGAGSHKFTLLNSVGTPIDNRIDQSTGFFDNLPAGIYFVLLEDAQGCPLYTTKSINVEQPASALTFTTVKTHFSCYASNNGYITINVAGGTAPYKYAVNNVNSWVSFTGTSKTYVATEPGIFKIWVNDANGCITGPTEVEILQPALLIPKVTVVNDALCNGTATGKITVSATGGWAGMSVYNYKVNDGAYGNAASIAALSLPFGTHTLYVKDVAAYNVPYQNSTDGCVKSVSFSIGQPDPIVYDVNISSIKCRNAADGTLTVTILSGGVPFYTNDLNDANDGFDVQITGNAFNMTARTGFDKTVTFTGLLPSFYTVRIVDKNGCTLKPTANDSATPWETIESWEVQQPATNLSIRSVEFINDATCFGAMDGKFKINASGGSPFSEGGYKYFAGLSIEPDGHVLVPVAPVETSDLWKNSNEFSVGAGTWVVWVMDKNGCMIGGETLNGVPQNAWRVKIAQPTEIKWAFHKMGTAPNDTIHYVMPSCNGDEDGKIHLVNVTGGDGVYTATVTGKSADGTDKVYTQALTLTNGLWMINNVAASDANGYQVKVTDSKGCGTKVATVVIKEPKALGLTLAKGDNQFTCPDAVEGFIEATATGGTRPYTYSLYKNGVLHTENVSPSAFLVEIGNTFRVVVKDAKGCTAESTITINPVKPVVATLSETTCYGNAKASVIVSAEGDPGRTFAVRYRLNTEQWTNTAGEWHNLNSANALKIIDLVFANVEDTENFYYFQIKDSEGCITEEIRKSFVPTQHPLEVTVVQATDEASASMTITGGISPYSYQVGSAAMVYLPADGNTFQDVPLQAPATVVTVYDAHGCMVAKTIPVAPLTVTANPASGDNMSNTFDVVLTFNRNVIIDGGITVTGGISSINGTGKVYRVAITAVDLADVKVMLAATIKDAANNMLTATSFTYTVGDHVNPTVEVTDPAVPVTAKFNVGLAFSEPVSGVEVVGGITVNGGTVVVTPEAGGKKYTLAVTSTEQKLVTIVIANTIKDMSLNMNPFAGQTLTYNTGDFTKPVLDTKTPTSGSTIADNHPIIRMTFSENVVLGTSGSLKIYKVDGPAIPALTIPITANMIVGKDVNVVYTTTNGLDKNTSYYILVDGAALKDNAGNAFDGVSGTTTWTFKTGDKFVTSIDPNSSLEFKVYPNPFVDFVNVDNSSELSKIVVTNIAGQIVKEVVNPTSKIQLNELRSGIYFMSLYNTEDVIVKTAKIVKR